MPNPVTQTRDLNETIVRLVTEYKINKHTSADWALKYAAEAGCDVSGITVEDFAPRLPHLVHAGTEALTEILADAYKVLSKHVNIMGNGERNDDPLVEALRDHAFITDKFVWAVLRAVNVNCKGGGGYKDGRISPAIWEMVDKFIV